MHYAKIPAQNLCKILQDNFKEDNAVNEVNYQLRMLSSINREDAEVKLDESFARNKVSINTLQAVMNEYKLKEK